MTKQNIKRRTTDHLFQKPDRFEAFNFLIALTFAIWGAIFTIAHMVMMYIPIPMGSIEREAFFNASIICMAISLFFCLLEFVYIWRTK